MYRVKSTIYDYKVTFGFINALLLKEKLLAQIPNPIIQVITHVTIVINAFFYNLY